MKKTLVATFLTGLVLTGFAGPAFADPVIVDEPDTGGLENPYTFAPGGIPVNGLIESITKAPGRILPI
ncbi:hypothetical protein Lesp02_32160 [Lentzea sp. NBRC 105346]|uniref:hypothetical protein n=1 Tax=Lentzea sp. NBRC 105346 TaxID=3032205 RepID=UPI0024A3C773|nr:hypothetical protein [Lentzea sp. NBRC 105346]GLZ31027.1 hypothetical protein Lesp02_32160 [Lentzea sp. NBRC 105346]